MSTDLEASNSPTENPPAAETPATIPVTAGETPAEATEGAAATSAASCSEGDLIDALRTVIDPELMIDIVNLGLVYSVEQEADKVMVEMTLTSPACPAGPQIVQQAKMALEQLPGVNEAQIRLTLSPPWTPDRMTDDARDKLGIF